MNTSQLEAFVATAKTKSLTAAAKQLFLTPQSLTQQVNNLESELGVPLFDRTPKGVSLTSAGEQFLEDARRILQLMGAARERAVAIAGGHPSVSICHWHTSSMALRLSQELASRQPNLLQTHVQPTGDPRTGERELLDDTYDLLEWVGDTREEHEGLSFTPLLPVSLILLVRRNHPLAQLDRVTLADLDGHDLYLTDPAWYTSIVRELAQQAPGATVHAIGYSEMSLIETCTRGDVLLGWDNVPIATEGFSVVPVSLGQAFYLGFLHKESPRPPAEKVLELAQELFGPVAVRTTDNAGAAPRLP